MEALWNLEDKWKLSTQKAVALFSCISMLVISTICVVTALKRRSKCRQKRVDILSQEPCGGGDVSPPVYRRWDSVKKALMGSVRWSGRSKWEEEGRFLRGSQRETPTPLLVGRNQLEGLDVGWQSRNSTSAVWQRPILMGEKCELPRFSGLILYDQRGMPLHQCEEDSSSIHIQELKQPVRVERITLKDLL